MTTYNLATLVLILESTLYGLIVVTTVRRRGLREWDSRWLVLYAALSGLWVLGQAILGAGRLAPMADLILRHISISGLLLLAWMFLYLTRSFLRLERAAWSWFIVTVAGALGLVALDGDVLGLPNTIWSGSSWSLQKQTLIFGAMVVGWGLFMAGRRRLAGCQDLSAHTTAAAQKSHHLLASSLGPYHVWRCLVPLWLSALGR